MASPDRAVNLAEKFSAIREHWSPKIVGEINDHQIKLAKVQGEFVWHSHDATDELFLVHSGRLTIELRNAETVVPGPGEFFIVPRAWSTGRLRARSAKSSCSNLSASSTRARPQTAT